MSDQEKPKNDEDSVKPKSEKEAAPKTEVAPPKVAKIVPHSPSSDDEEFSEFDDVDEKTTFLSALKTTFHPLISRKRILLPFGIFLVVLLLLYFFLFSGGLHSLKRFWPFGSAETPPAVTLQPSDITTSDLATAYHFGFYPTLHTSYPPSLQMSYMLGGILPTQFFLISPQESGLQLAYHFGFRGYSYDRLEEYIATVRQIQSALTTDIQASLNHSTDRRLVLSALIRDFDTLYAHAVENAGLVAKEVVSFQTQASTLRNNKSPPEKNFNTNLSTFLPRESRQSLEDFISVSKNEVEVRAQLGAFTQLDKYYQIAVVKLAARIKDLKANQEALVKGINVFDIKNSDLNIIHYEGTPPVDSLATPIVRTAPGSGKDPIDFAMGIH